MFSIPPKPRRQPKESLVRSTIVPFTGIFLVVLSFPSVSDAAFGDTLVVAVDPDSVGDSIFSWPMDDAGDINGDGWNDVIVGDANYDAPPDVDVGRAYVYFLGPGMDDIPDLVITGSAAYQECGFDVSSAGDMNGDGRDDLAVGVQNFGGSRGRVCIFWGDSTLTGEVSVADADVKLTGEGALIERRFGWNVELMDDLNGDGLNELLVTTYTRRAYVFFGDSTLSGVVPASDADIIITGFDAGSVAQQFAASSGDFNGDDVPDIVVGNSGSNLAVGEARIFLGNPGATGQLLLTAADADMVITGEEDTPLPFFGTGVNLRGDVNGDGLDDLVVGSAGIGYPDTTESTGAIYVFHGRSSVPDSLGALDADVRIYGEDCNCGGRLGLERPQVGDQNGDGYADLLVGAHYMPDEGGGAFAGRVYLFIGGPQFLDTLTTRVLFAYEADAMWIGFPGAKLGRSKAWVPNSVPGSNGAIVLGAFVYPYPEYRRFYVIDAGQGLSPTGGPPDSHATIGAPILECRPSPFRNATLIRYELPAASAVDLGVYDVAGRLVRTLESGFRGPGAHGVRWDRNGSDGRWLPAGVYFVRLAVGGDRSAATKVVVLD